MDDIRVLPNIGIIGGTGWSSTEIYLKEIPRRVQKKLGGLNSPNVVFMSKNFAQIDTWMHEGNWDAVKGLFTEMALQMRRNSKISALAVLSNTLHKVAPEVAEIAGVPLIHIGDCTAKFACANCVERTGFIGTKFTMQEDFILKCFRTEGIEVFTPPKVVMDGIDEIIFNELCKNHFKEDSRDFLFHQVVEMISRHHIDSVVLGCTELGLTMTKEYWTDFCERNNIKLRNFPFIDTTECHIEAIVTFCCNHVA